MKIFLLIILLLSKNLYANERGYRPKAKWLKIYKINNKIADTRTYILYRDCNIATLNNKNKIIFAECQDYYTNEKCIIDKKNKINDCDIDHAFIPSSEIWNRLTTNDENDYYKLYNDEENLVVSKSRVNRDEKNDFVVNIILDKKEYTYYKRKLNKKNTKFNKYILDGGNDILKKNACIFCFKYIHIMNCKGFCD